MCNFKARAPLTSIALGGWVRGGKEMVNEGTGAAVPAEVQQGARGGGDALCRPAEEVELGKCTCFLRLNVFQVEAAHQEVIAPDVLRH